MKVEWNGTPGSQKRRRGHRPKHQPVPANAGAAESSNPVPSTDKDEHSGSKAMTKPETPLVESDAAAVELSESNAGESESRPHNAKARRASRRAKKRKKFQLQRIDAAHEDQEESAVSIESNEEDEANGEPALDVAEVVPASDIRPIRPISPIPISPILDETHETNATYVLAEKTDQNEQVIPDISVADNIIADNITADDVIADFHAAVEAAEPQAIPPSKWRVRFAAIGVICIWLVLVARLVFLQAISQVDLSARALNQRLYVENVQARPGDIVDRHGRLLATTVKSRSLFVDPKRIEKHWEFAQRVAIPLGLEPDALFERLMQSRKKRFLWIKRRLTEAEAEDVERLELPEGTWGFRVEYLRRYPQGSLGAHVLGLRDIDGIGRGGVEQSCDELLAGKDGRRVLDRDARGVVVNIRKEIARAPRRGRTVMLTMDSVIQLHTERELNKLVRDWRPKSACAIVMDARNGEVLAMTSRPNFNPNLPAEVADDAWTNHCLSSIYEPGSTIKPLIVSWAMEQGLLKRDESLNCEWGKYKMGPRILNDHHKYGWLSLTDILVKSSNIGMAKIGERLENKGLYEAVRRFGFGQTTGIELSGELPGLVRTLDRWDSYSTGSVPMGQEIAVTPLQMITAQAALANHGKLPQPHLLLKHYPVLARLNNDSVKESVTPKFLSSVVSEDIADWLIKEPMAQVVTRGTGKRVGASDYRVFGKTGTSQKIDPATGTYSRTKVVTSFICGAPVESPRVLVFVLADEPTAPGLHFGGTVAAPTAGKILNKALIHLRVSPERDVDQVARQR